MSILPIRHWISLLLVLALSNFPVRSEVPGNIPICEQLTLSLHPGQEPTRKFRNPWFKVKLSEGTLDLDLPQPIRGARLLLRSGSGAVNPNPTDALVEIPLDGKFSQCVSLQSAGLAKWSATETLEAEVRGLQEWNSSTWKLGLVFQGKLPAEDSPKIVQSRKTAKDALAVLAALRLWREEADADASSRAADIERLKADLLALQGDSGIPPKEQAAVQAQMASLQSKLDAAKVALGHAEKRIRDLGDLLSKAGQQFETARKATEEAEMSPAPWPEACRVQFDLAYQADADDITRMHMYLGSTWLQSVDDFGKTLPELRLDLQTTYLGSPSSRAFLEGSGELGLTATQVTGVKDAKSESLGTRAFLGSLGLGLGVRWSPGGGGGAGRLSLQVLAQFGVLTTPAIPKSGDRDAIPGGSHNQTFFGFKLRNETGFLSGAYVAAGFGRSEQFRNAFAGGNPIESRFVSRRFKVDGFLPITTPNKAARVALRIQSDQPDHSWSGGRSHLPADTRISLLVPVDITKLATFLKGSGAL